MMSHGIARRSCADIIPFPSRFKRSTDGKSTLGRDLNALEQANAELRDAIAIRPDLIKQLAIILGETVQTLDILDGKLREVSLRLNHIVEEKLSARFENLSVPATVIAT